MADKPRFASLSLEENEKCENSFVFMTKQEWVQGQNCGGKCLEASGRKAWIFKLP